jgi:hypothetical protein
LAACGFGGGGAGGGADAIFSGKVTAGTRVMKGADLRASRLRVIFFAGSLPPLKMEGNPGPSTTHAPMAAIPVTSVMIAMVMTLMPHFRSELRAGAQQFQLLRKTCFSHLTAYATSTAT